MSVAVFGPLTLEGVTLSPRERAVLAALVLRAGRPVTTDELADALWGDEPPGTWPKQLQASIGRVRTAVGRNAIETAPGAYILRIDPDTVDAERFERLAASARRHLDDDPARAVDAAERALSLWRGTPYADLASWPPALVESERLDEVRMELEEVRVDGHLRLGEHAASVADAERLVREAPLRERRWVLLATALYRSGRQADALAAIRSARDRLADELGAEPGAELSELELGILRHDDSLDLGEAPTSPSAACPYRGLQPYNVEDEGIFFGRDADIGAALGRLARSRFLAVSGASGSGKSSLVRAGVVPALQRRGDRVVILSPEHDLDIRIRDAVGGARRADVVIVDQFEEVFHAGEADVDAAARAIADAAANETTVVLVVRSEFLDDCAAHPDLAPLVAEGVHLVGPMSPEALREAVEQPAGRAGLRLESGLVEVILRDAAGEAGALPHLSHALVETWLRREGATLTVAGYEASGGISGAIAQSADRLYQSMDPEQRVTCHWLLLRLVALGPDGSAIRRRVPSKPLRADPAREQVLAMLARSRLVSAEAESVEVAHESLATAWPRLKAWLEEDAEGARILTAVAAAAEAWNAAGRPDDDLFRGVRLQAALEWRDSAPYDLTDVESAFLDASAARATAEQEQFAERARRDRRQNRRLRVLLGVAAGLIVLLVGAGSVAVVSSEEANAQRDSATIEGLTSTSLSLRASERDVAALLAAEAYRRWPDDPRTRSALMGAMTQSHGLLATTYLEGVDNMAGTLIPGTRRAVAVTVDGVAVYDIDSGALMYPVDLPKESVDIDSRYGPAVSGNGARVANAERIYDDTDAQVGRRLSVADVTTGALLLPAIELDFPLSSITMDHEGILIAAIDEIGALRLIDANTGLVRQVTGTSSHEAQWNTDRAGAVRFTPDGRVLYGTVEGPLLVVDPDTASVVATILMPAESANVSMTVVSDTHVITTGDRRISSVDLVTGRVDWSQPFATESDDQCSWVTASVELRTVYCGDLFGHIEERSLDTGAPTERSFDPQLGFVGNMSVVEVRRELVVVGRGNAITRWKLDGSGAVTRVMAPGWVIRDEYSPTGSSLVVARRTADAEWWADYREFAVLDTRAEDLTLRVPNPSYGVKWAGKSTLVGDFGGVGPQRSEFLDTRTAEIFSGDPLPDDALDVWTNAEGDRMYVGRPGEIWTVDPTTGRRMEPTLETDGGDPVFISTSPDGSRVLVTSWNMELAPDSIIFDGETGERIGAGLVGIGRTALTARGEIVSVIREQTIVRYDADTFERIGALPGASGGLDSLNVSADGRVLTTYSLDNTVSVYDLEGGIRLGDPIPVSSEWNFPGQGTYSGVLRADGAELAVNVPAGIAVWDLRPSSHVDAACRMAGRDLTRDEWIAYLSALGPYRSTCGFGAAEPVGEPAG